MRVSGLFAVEQYGVLVRFEEQKSPEPAIDANADMDLG
jgi:hypothetical protein